MPFTRNTKNNKRTLPSEGEESQEGIQQPARRPGQRKKAPKILPQNKNTTEIRQESTETAQETTDNCPQASGSDRQVEDDCPEIPLANICLNNYHKAKNTWTLERIKDQLSKQSVHNQKISPLILKEAKTLFCEFDHSLHILAMISGCSLESLKQKIGLASGTHAENKWHRWLSFSVEANKHPMPPRGHPDSAAILSIRNSHNSEAYQNLTEDQSECLTKRVFHALGGYPDYSAISMDNFNPEHPKEILVPQVPTLEPDEEARLRPIYNRMFDHVKIARDKETHLQYSSAESLDSRALHSFNKQKLQLERSHMTLGMDYLLIACSNNKPGEGWNRTSCSQEPFRGWLNVQFNFEDSFALYHRGKKLAKDVRRIEASSSSSSKPKRSDNNSDKEKKKLGGLLNESLVKVLGTLPPKGFPRISDPLEILKKRNIPVIIDQSSGERPPKMSEEIFLKGFNKMSASERRLWLGDIESGAFKILPAPRVEGRISEGSKSSGDEEEEDEEAEEAGDADEEVEEMLVATQGDK